MKTAILARDFIQVFKICDNQVTLKLKTFELEIAEFQSKIPQFQL